MALRDFSECIGQKLIWEVGGRHGTYEGILEIDTTGRITTYMLRTNQLSHPNLGSLTPNEFNRVHRVNENNEIVKVEEMAIAA